MKNNKTLYIVIAVLVLAVIGGGIFFLSKKGMPTPSSSTPSTAPQTSVGDTTMVDCSGKEDPMCFINRMNQCLPVTVKMTGSDSKTEIEITILGVENEKCHFQRKINGALSLDCYFPKGTLNMDTLDQTFGNDRGLQKVVDDACKSAGW